MSSTLSLATLLPYFLISFGVLVLFFLLMSIGFLVKKQPLKGSCGGVANLMGDEFCQFCGNDPNKCDGRLDEQTQSKAQDLSKPA